MTLRWILIAAFFIFLQACARSDAGAPLSPQSEEAQALGFSEIPPLQVGGPWKRKIQVRVENPAFLTIEKRNHSGQGWDAIGFSNEKGIFVDEDTAQSVEYWVGRKWRSPRLAGLSDLVLGGTLHENSRFQAHRILIPDFLEIGEHHVIIEADILQIEGQLRAFDPASEGGRSAGSVVVTARLLTGRGALALNGQKGRPGSAGAPGAAGAPGHFAVGGDGSPGGAGGRGQAGGAGGQLWAQVDSLDPSIKISVVGGQGGKGGPAGDGGKGGPGGRRGRIEDNMLDYPGGRSGASGKVGEPGEAGKEGRVLISSPVKD